MAERRVLESWKGISAYLGRTEKTCRKWERELGLPVHRLEESPKAHVFAYTDELERWKAAKIGARLRFRLVGGLAIIALAVAGILIWQAIRKGDSPGGRAVKGVAVLPFVDLSPDKRQEHIGDGISDVLINALTRVEGLRVPARTSAFFFKGKEVTPAEIGRRLKVELILEGSVQIDGDKLRVVASLFRAADGTALWTERYDRKPFDIFAVENDIAQGVAKALALRLRGKAGAPAADPGTQNIEAYNLFLQGQRFMGRGRQLSQQAIAFFEKALEKDQNFAEAHALISRCYLSLGHVGLLPQNEAGPKAREAAIRALEIDGDNSNALGTLASIKLIYEWDFAGAEKDIRQAIQNHPADARLHADYADLLSAMGRGEEALKEINLAVELNPLSGSFLGLLAMRGYYYSRKYEPALETLKKALELEPFASGIYVNSLAVYLAMGRFEEARAVQQRRREILGHSNAPEENDLYFGLIHAYAGEEDEARKHLARYKETMKTSYIKAAMIVAWVNAALGDKDEAFAWLEKAVREREGSVYRLKVEPLIDPLRSDPRFTELLRRIGLEK